MLTKERPTETSFPSALLRAQAWNRNNPIQYHVGSASKERNPFKNREIPLLLKDCTINWRIILSGVLWSRKTDKGFLKAVKTIWIKDNRVLGPNPSKSALPERFISKTEGNPLVTNLPPGLFRSSSLFENRIVFYNIFLFAGFYDRNEKGVSASLTAIDKANRATNKKC